MFVIVVYDVAEKRTNKVNKILKKYLQWTQNSLFEGKITKGNLKMCMNEIENVIKKDIDSVYVYKIENPNHINKIIYGKEKDFESLCL